MYYPFLCYLKNWTREKILSLQDLKEDKANYDKAKILLYGRFVSAVTFSNCRKACFFLLMLAPSVRVLLHYFKRLFLLVTRNLMLPVHLGTWKKQATVEMIIVKLFLFQWHFNPAPEYSEKNRWHSLKSLYPLHLFVSEYSGAEWGWIKILLD